jgi:signal transduction histidine kinase
MATQLWPTGLIGRVGLVLGMAIALELVASTFVFERAELVSTDDALARRIAVQLDSAARVLEVTDRDQRHAVAKGLTEPELSFDWHEAKAGPGPAATDDHVRILKAKLIADEPTLAKRDLALGSAGGTSDVVYGQLALADGSLVTFRAHAPESGLPSLFGQIASVVLLSSCVLLAALLVVRTLAAPLRMLVEATDAIGRGPAVHLDDAKGPREIRRVARAFNAMQDRIAGLLKDRIAALAAVSPDLRTPIARMRLRADMIGGEEARAIDRDLAEMEAMLDALNAHLRGDTDPEKPRRFNIAATLQTLVDDAADAGKAATYVGPDQLALSARPLALKRAFSNIVNNAIAYGDRAGVALADGGDEVLVTVDDDGPGIPDAERDAVFEAFYRGDHSRNRAKGGMGLGLAIARAAVTRDGGTIALVNRPEGGLRVTITLPKT